MPHTKEIPWGTYRENELSALRPILHELGFELEAEQPHLGGERGLTGAPGSGRKLVLLARRTVDTARAVVKVSSDPRGIEEIEHERVCWSMLEKILFAYQVFLSPKELVFSRSGPYAILITEFIEQEQSFIQRSVQEQFALALKAFKAQESAHATTYAHTRAIKQTFGEMNAADYHLKIQDYAADLKRLLSSEKGIYPESIVNDATTLLGDNQHVLDQYGSFLTHWDFTPQNIRVRGGDIYLLDHSSLRFGNKYEGWARFINFMALYNPLLAEVLVQYVRDNRTPEESLSLNIMRIYRLVELIRYYATWLPRTEGDLHALAKARVVFWSSVLQAVLENKEVAPHIIEEYKQKRDSLRSEEEKKRQINLH